MHFLWLNVTFYDAVNMIHAVITTANPIPYTAKFMLSVLEITKLYKSDIRQNYVRILFISRIRSRQENLQKTQRKGNVTTILVLYAKIIVR